MFDINYGADETTVIDTEELMINKEKHITTFTSCCPSWVAYC